MPRILKIKRGLTRSAFRHSAVGSKKKTVSVKHLINGQLVSTGQVKQITTQKGPTQHKQDVLKELSRRYLMLRRGYLLRFYPTAMIEKVLGSSDQLVKENCPDFLSVEMLTHYHKMAMEEAIAIARAGWEQDFVEVKQLIYHNPRWNNLERNELCYLLAAPGLISKIILGQVIEAPKPEWQINDQRVLCAYLKRLVLKHRASFPHHERQKRALVIDNRLYDLFTRPEDKFFKGCWLRISTFPNEKRICIPLAGKDLGNLNGKTRKNLRVILEPDGRILFTIPYEISIPRVVKTKEKLNIEEAKKELLVDPTLEVVAIDKGMVNTIIANATDDPTQAEFYGDGGLPKKVSDKQEAKLKNRQRLQAYARELVKSEKPEDWAKAGRIQLNNLGKVKQTHQNTRDKASVTRLINQSANQLFQAHPQMRVLVEEDLTNLRAEKGVKSKTFNRCVSSWARGALTKAIENKCPVHGVDRQLVAAAYTSQACPVCFYVNSKNRSNQVFHCRNCGYDAHADAVASSNIRVRFFDPDISRYTSRAKIKEILLQRYQRRSELASGVQTAVG